MRKFQFSLETLLELRKEQELEQRISLAQAVGTLANVETKIEQARSAGERALSRPAKTLDDFILRERILQKAGNDERKLQPSRVSAKKKVDEEQQKYAEAYSGWSALNRLKENKKAVWKKQLRREEMNQLDEVAAAARLRQR